MCRIVHIADFDTLIVNEVIGLIRDEEIFGSEFPDDEILDLAGIDVPGIGFDENEVEPIAYADVDRVELVTLAREPKHEDDSTKSAAQAA